jgi:hypothetical protein
VICGNKVPTIAFGGFHLSRAEQDDLADLWLAIANSFALDWYARRVLTTTVNFFILLGLAYPRLDVDSLPARRLIALVRSLDQALNARDATRWANTRAEMDARVFQLYGLSPDQVRVLFQDFPLLDRGQPPIVGEQSSTITRDLVLAHLLSILGTDATPAVLRVDKARAAGACAYVAAEWAGAAALDKEDANIG